VRAGAGIGQRPAFVAKSDVASGRLIKVLKQTSANASGLALLFPRSRLMTTTVAAFRDHLLSYLAENPLAG